MRGKTFYDLGIINPQNNPSVYRFKSRINGREVTFISVFDYCENEFLNFSVNIFELIILYINDYAWI